MMNEVASRYLMLARDAMRDFIAGKIDYIELYDITTPLGPWRWASSADRNLDPQVKLLAATISCIDAAVAELRYGHIPQREHLVQRIKLRFGSDSPECSCPPCPICHEGG